MQVISVDIGNSAIKLGIPAKAGPLQRVRIELDDDDRFQKELPSGPCGWSICSVNQKKSTWLVDWISHHRPGDNFYLIQADDVPLKSDVDSRQLLGRDRLVAAWKANSLFDDGKEIVVVDAGTAVTIDKVDSDGVFQGGVIFPGAGSCLKLLSRSTSNLPDFSQHQLSIETIAAKPIGKNTEFAILRGVYQSQRSALMQIVENLSNDCHVVATGGEIEFMQERLPSHWQIEPLLVLLGAQELGIRLFEEQLGKK